MEIRGTGRDMNQRIVPEIKGSYLIFHYGTEQDGNTRNGTGRDRTGLNNGKMWYKRDGTGQESKDST